MMADEDFAKIHAAFLRPGMYAGEQGERSVFEWRRDAAAALLSHSSTKPAGRTLKDFGYAPGGYSIKCSDCPPDQPLGERPLADKRAWRCKEHAQERLDSYLLLGKDHLHFNMNHTVRVKLNALGLKILRDRHEEMRRVVPSVGDFQAPKTDELGYCKMQLWSLMQTFGPHISLGMHPPFEAEIVIPKDPK